MANSVKAKNYKKIWGMALFCVVLFGVALMLGFTQGLLFSSKKATGSITFALTNSPEMSLNLNFVADANHKTYLGTTTGAQISSASDVVRANIKENSTLKIEVRFEDNVIYIPNGFTITTHNGVVITNTANDNGVAEFATSGDVQAGDYVIIDKLLSEIYPKTEISNKSYQIIVTSQAGASVPATAKLSGIYSTTVTRYNVNITQDADYGNIVSSTGSTSLSIPYGATYTSSGNTLTIKNAGGATLATITATPNANTAQYTYGFSGWSSESGSITAVTNIKANFARTTNQYTVTFYNEDGSPLGVTSTVDYGGTATYTGTTPTKDGYQFVGWSKTQGGTTNDGLTNVTGNRNVYAIFKAAGYTITITGQYANSFNYIQDDGVLIENFESGKTKFMSGHEIKVNVGFSYVSITSEFGKITAELEEVESCAGDVYSFAMPQSNVTITFNSTHRPPICCVSEDALITLADGTTKRADEIVVGDKVLTYNFETGEVEEDIITQTLQRNRKELITINFVDGTNIKITNDHPLFTENGWKCYDVEFGSKVYNKLGIESAFEIGDKLFSLSTYFDKEIVSIEYEEKSGEEYFSTYQFKTANNRNYFANGVLSASL